ncbi:MAG: hypothetical protein Q9199_005531 [Rusavskia elegans]
MARRAFMTETGEKVRRIGDGEGEEEGAEAMSATKGDAGLMPPPPVPAFKRVVKKKKDLGAALGIKKKPALNTSAAKRFLSLSQLTTSEFPYYPRDFLSAHPPPPLNTQSAAHGMPGSYLRSRRGQGPHRREKREAISPVDTLNQEIDQSLVAYDSKNFPSLNVCRTGSFIPFAARRVRMFFRKARSSFVSPPLKLVEFDSRVSLQRLLLYLNDVQYRLYTT